MNEIDGMTTWDQIEEKSTGEKEVVDKFIHHIKGVILKVPQTDTQARPSIMVQGDFVLEGRASESECIKGNF